MAFTEMGFLSPDSSQWIRIARSKHSDLFRISDAALRMCQKQIYEFELGTELRPVLVAALYARCLSNYQGVILCIERGMEPEGAILARALLEATFVINAIHRNPELAQLYVDEDILIRKKFATKFKQSNPGYFADPLVAAEVKDLEQTLEVEKSEAGITSRLSTEQWAEHAGMSAEYKTIYALLSADCHVYARRLSDQHLVPNATGVVEYMKFEPSDEVLPQTVLSATSWLLSSYRAASDTLIAKMSDEFDTLTNEVQRHFGLLGSALS